MHITKVPTVTTTGLDTGSFALVANGERVLHPSVSDRYRQLERPLELFQAVADRTGIPLESYGISDRNAIWAAFTIEKERRTVGETFRYSLVLSEVPLKGFIARTHILRLRCTNGLTTNFGAVILRERHVGECLDVRLRRSLSAFDRVPQEIANHGLLVEYMLNQPVSAPDALDAFTLHARPGLGTIEAANDFRRERAFRATEPRPVFDAWSAAHDLPRAQRLFTEYNHGDGAVPGTLFGVHQALTYKRPFDADARSEARDLRTLSALCPGLRDLAETVASAN